ncbi:hypothetical protein AJ80_08469 [Polytolypa hystricis UAMH7299]|uniref:Zn(2)-C6 fungal-type domain-containing protein n=1 Tax=Polytolypa hystricis (strain UAMH7299) TaxID=1447883 RepID=A0A2B7X7I2_POLH7|nr:hypothetical protein AJ80_08469 [Polytolypa hystricis UAMH7299]
MALHSPHSQQNLLQDLDDGLDEPDSLSPGSSSREQGGGGGSAQDDLAQNAASAGQEGTGLQQQDQDKDNPLQPPPWSELKTKAGKERKRLPLACIACRRKKIRCSGEKPACKHCFRSRIPCVYKVTTRKAAPRTDYMAMLDKRLKRMEERVIKAIPKEDARDMTAIGRSVVKPPVPGQAPRQVRALHKKRSADEAFSAELDGWARRDRPIHHPEGALSAWQPQAVDENKLLVEGAEFLPSMELQEHLAEVFFDCVYGQSYLLLHKPSFMRKLRAGTVPPVLMLAICAISARFSNHPEVGTDPPFLRGEAWANPAVAIALNRHDEPNITILTVFLILGLHEFGACHGGRSWSFGGQALRMAYALQLHQELDRDPYSSASKLSFTDREIRRRTMWACVLMDRYNSSGSQRPPIGNEKYLHIQLPIKESYFQMEIPGPTEDLDGHVPNPVSDGVGQLASARENMGVSAYIIRAIMLWGHIVDYFNLGGKNQDPHPMWSPESGYTKLKKQLEDFSASLPNSLSFTLENLRNHAAEKIVNQFLYLHIIIHQNILFLNRFAIPLSPGGRPPKDIPKPFLSDAGRAAVEAASHISMLIDQASGYLLTVPFAGYCSYAASTVHIWGLFSKNPRLEARSRQNLRHTYGYLNKMKQYWGMFHYMVESAKDRYRHFANAAIMGQASDSDEDSTMFQYGDWFDKYPHGVSRAYWKGQDRENARDSGGDAVMAQQSDLQSVEDFFASLSPPSHADTPRKGVKRQDPATADRRSHKAPGNHYEAVMPQQPQHRHALTPQPPQQQQQQQQQQHHHSPSHQPGILDISMTGAQPLISDPTSPAFTNFKPPTQQQPPPPPPPPPPQQPYFPQVQQPQPPQQQQAAHQPFDPSAFNFSFNPEQLPQLDRQIVYGAYASLDPMTSTPTPSDATAVNNPTATTASTPTPAGVRPGAPGGDTAAAAAGGTPNNNNGNNNLGGVWHTSVDMSAISSWHDGFLQPNAWFLPFNIDPVGTPLDIPPAAAAAGPTPSLDSDMGGGGGPGGEVAANGRGGGGGGGYDEGMLGTFKMMDE